jgi:hypothetical protein
MALCRVYKQWQRGRWQAGIYGRFRFKYDVFRGAKFTLRILDVGPFTVSYIRD